jgi:cation:H+ antiporter
MIVHTLLTALGPVLLTWSADHLVLGASRLGRQLRISPVVIGVVVIGVGTSMPEFLVSGIAAARGENGDGPGLRGKRNPGKIFQTRHCQVEAS